MHQLLDNYLCTRYPLIFCDRNKSEMDSCLHWGFAVGDGWYSLITSLCGSIQSHIDNPQWVFNEKTKIFEKPKRSTCPQVIAEQVKEKMSGLKFHASGGDEYTRTLIHQAEQISYSICEICGKMNYEVGRNSKGRIQTTCRAHARNPEDFKVNGNDELTRIWKLVLKKMPDTRHVDRCSAGERKR